MVVFNVISSYSLDVTPVIIDEILKLKKLPMVIVATQGMTNKETGIKY